MSLLDKIEIIKGDITDLAVDAIVNAANTDLKLGSGVAGAIRTNGGPSIQIECDEHGSVSLGDAAITGAGNLPARCVIHAAAMHLGGVVTKDSLTQSIENCLRIASENNIKSIAFPAIGTGVGNFPLDECASIMLKLVFDFLGSKNTSLNKVYFVLFDSDSYNIFKDMLDTQTVE